MLIKCNNKKIFQRLSNTSHTAHNLFFHCNKKEYNTWGQPLPFAEHVILSPSTALPVSYSIQNWYVEWSSHLEMLNGPTEMLRRVFGTWLTGSNPAILICSLLALVMLQTATRTSPQFPLSGTSNSMVGSVV